MCVNMVHYGQFVHRTTEFVGNDPCVVPQGAVSFAIRCPAAQLEYCPPHPALTCHLPHPEGREGSVSVELYRIWCIENYVHYGLRFRCFCPSSVAGATNRLQFSSRTLKGEKAPFPGCHVIEDALFFKLFP